MNTQHLVTLVVVISILLCMISLISGNLLLAGVGLVSIILMAALDPKDVN